jgi:ATP-dependent DNA helicase
VHARYLQVQTIGLLSHLRSKGVNGPFMVVGPLSTLPNWVAEFERWCPSMPAVLYHGTKLERQQLRSKRLPMGALHEQ